MAPFAALRVTAGLTVAVVVLASACGQEASSMKGRSEGPADLLRRGGAVYTVDAPRSWATAIGVKGGRIIAQPRLDSLAAALDREGWQLHVHAIGDRAIRMTLDAFAHAMMANGPRDSRHTIAHLQLVDPADLPRFRSLGVVANFEPLWANGDEYLTSLAEPALGRSRSRWLYPIGSVVEAGAVVSGGSDWSVSSLAPLDGMQVAITRRTPSDSTATAPWLAEEVVDLSTAIAMYTINAAYQNHQEGETGSIEVGKVADLVILEKNLFEVAPRDIHAVRVMWTMLEGRTVFERGR